MRGGLVDQDVAVVDQLAAPAHLGRVGDGLVVVLVELPQALVHADRDVEGAPAQIGHPERLFHHRQRVGGHHHRLAAGGRVHVGHVRAVGPAGGQRLDAVHLGQPGLDRAPHERLVVVERLDLAQRPHALALDARSPGAAAARPRAGPRRAARGRAAVRPDGTPIAGRASRSRGPSRNARDHRGAANHTRAARRLRIGSRRHVELAERPGRRGRRRHRRRRHGLRGRPAAGAERGRRHRRSSAASPAPRPPAPPPASWARSGSPRDRARCSSWGCRAGRSIPPSPSSCTSCPASTSATPARA